MSHPSGGGLFAIFLICVLVFVDALPTSVLKDLKTDALNMRKVKRAQETFNNDQKETFSAIKRGGSNNMRAEELPLLSEWDQRRFREQQQQQEQQQQEAGFDAADIPRSLYRSELGADGIEGKSMSEYAKGFRYGTNRDQLNRDVQNAILKSEIYGDPATLNQYQYYGDDAKKRRRRFARSNAKSNDRRKRDINDLTPEEILTILSLWEMNDEDSMRRNFNNRENNRVRDRLREDDEDWLQTPVRPHLNERLQSQSAPNQEYWYNTANNNNGESFEKRGRWFGLHGNKKRFMVSKRQTADSTSEIRYLNSLNNGPSRNSFYTLNELMGGPGAGGHQIDHQSDVHRRSV